MDAIRYEDTGPPNPRQAEVDRLRDAAAKHAAPGRTSSGGGTAPAAGSAGGAIVEQEPGPQTR